ncbi:hypothetical protein LSH36_124g07015 [Paralvinella palmiformis]|uniref:Ig-like domain-containing protein n=1 Tax=Paralvinella palmiformis TaxID=53620 RepID=A0AAD9JX81_9ANNE|nr:hypothetical protein LSH36_124g07015 [Paralvinella palmiformis]
MNLYSLYRDQLPGERRQFNDKHRFPRKRYLLTMITEGQRYVLSEGESVILLCDFHAQHYNLFDYPVLWRKSQHDEELQVNIMGNLNAPFVTTKRFQVNFSQDPPMHRLELFITDVVPEDSGNYSCEVRGPASVILSTVTHYVFVRAPVESLALTAANYSGELGLTQDDNKHSRKITMIENTLNPLRCTARGGYPAPELSIKLGKEDITKQFRHSCTPVLTGEPGLRVITYTTELWTDSFIPSAEDDGAKLRCTAAVTGLKANTTAIKLDVHYSPKIICHSLAVYEWERNAVLRCEVWSKPDITTLFWIIDANGTTLSVGEVINEFWILILDKDENYLQTQLFMRQARPENFRTYTIVAENSVAASSKNVELYRKQKPTPQKPRKDKNVRNPSKQSGDGRYSNGYVTFSGTGTIRGTMENFLPALVVLIPTILR